MTALLALIRKEFAALFASPQGRGLLVMPVLLQLLLFPFAATLEVKNATLALYDQDGGAAAVELAQRLSAIAAFPHLIVAHGDEELKQAINEKHALLAIRIPQDFSRKLARGEAAPLLAIVDGRRSNAAQIAFGYAQQVVQQFADERAAQAPPARLIVRAVGNPNLEYRWFVLPSLVAIITTVGCLMVTALTLAREREEGTFDQVMVSPLSPIALLAGKALPGIVVALFQASLVAAGAVWAYHVPFTGSVAALYLAMLGYALALTGCGLFISALAGNQQQAFLGAFAFMSPAVILSGYMAPIENMPWPLRMIAAVDPLSHFLLIAKSIFLKGYGIADTWPHLWPLIAIAAVSLSLAYLLFRKRNL